MTDPIRALEHTHSHLSRRVLNMRRLVAKHARSASCTPELAVQLNTLRDALLDHFADEEEGLFPFARRTVPSLEESIDQLMEAHDAICGAVVRLAYRANRGASGKEIAAGYALLQARFSRHSRAEVALIKTLRIGLSPVGRARLSAELGLR